MKLFLSWSGSDARRLAELLREWLPLVIQSLEPWMSSEDIDKGARWSVELGRELEASGYGVVCVTPRSQAAPWLIFEAGALSNRFQTTRVSPFLLGLPPSELVGPLAQFQAVTPTRDDVFRLMNSLNATSPDQKIPIALLDKTFTREWDDLEKALAVLELAISQTTPLPTRRSQDDVLEELVVRVRGLERQHARQTPSEPLALSSAQSEMAERLPDITTLALRYVGGGLRTVVPLDNEVIVVVDPTVPPLMIEKLRMRLARAFIPSTVVTAGTVTLAQETGTLADSGADATDDT